MTSRAAGLLLALVLVAAPAARAAGPDTVYLEELTWTELRDRVAAGARTAIVPVGGTEQNGPHMVLGKHNVRVRVLAGRIARTLGGALVAPVVAYVPEGAVDPPSGHMRYPGTITVPEEAFRQVLEGAARSLRRHGFRDVVLIGDHGGTQAGQAAVAARLNRAWAGTGARVHAVEEYYRASEEGVAALLRERGHAPAELGTHAGLADTALALAVDPRLVRVEGLAAGPAPGAGDGVRGDPRRATAELGRPGVELVVARTVAAIRAALEGPAAATGGAPPARRAR